MHYFVNLKTYFLFHLVRCGRHRMGVLAKNININIPKCTELLKLCTEDSLFLGGTLIASDGRCGLAD